MTVEHVTDNLILDDLQFPEEPRWRGELLWFTDTTSEEIIAIDACGNTQFRHHIGTLGAGLGWMPDGTMTVVDTLRHRLLRLDPDNGRTSVHADLRSHVRHGPNGAITSRSGITYVGSVGFDLNTQDQPQPGAITIVDAEGQVRWGATDDLWFPNGITLTPDERTLIVAETFAARLSAYDIDTDGSLGDRRTWAILPDGTYPDGCCIDAEGMTWVADAAAKRTLRVAPGGDIAEIVYTPQRAYACALGGPNLDTLYVMTAKTHRPAVRAARTGAIYSHRVTVPGPSPAKPNTGSST